MKKSNPDELEAARARLKKAQADVGSKLMTGRKLSPEEKQALQAATEELKAATEEVDRLGGGQPEVDFEKLKADLDRRIGDK